MCIFMLMNCPICDKKIDTLEMIRTQGDGVNDWTVNRDYYCPHCQGKFRCIKVTINPTMWDEKLRNYKCTVAVPEFIILEGVGNEI